MKNNNIKDEAIAFMEERGFQFDPGVDSWDVEIDPVKGEHYDVVRLVIEFGVKMFLEGQMK